MSQRLELAKWGQPTKEINLWNCLCVAWFSYACVDIDCQHSVKNQYVNVLTHV